MAKLLRSTAHTRTALALYALLVVLPTAVFGGLHWHQLVESHEQELASLPLEAQGAIERFRRGVLASVEELLQAEDAQPFYVYRDEYWPEVTSDEIAALLSPLLTSPLPDGVRTYFGYDATLVDDTEVEYFAGPLEPEGWQEEREAYDDALADFIDWEQKYMAGRGLLEANSDELGIDLVNPVIHSEILPVETLALNLSDSRDEACLNEGLQQLRNSAPAYVEYDVWDFQLFVMRDELGRRFVLASRRVEFTRELENAVIDPCFERLEQSILRLGQGFFLHPDWLHDLLPRQVAGQVFDPVSQRLVLGEEEIAAVGPEQVIETLDLTEELPLRLIEGASPSALRMGVVIDASSRRASFRRQSLWFLGVALMMAISLAVGMWLLVQSVSASLERARSTENFVAAVSHELRTPIAAVKMYGEMLREGWVTSPEKQRDYLERIVRETDRLDGLVDRVLQKRRLGVGSPRPEAGDVSAEVSEMVPDLMLTAGTLGDDLEFQLEEGLPHVLLLPEALRAVVQNLVENARKYAAPGTEDERILVRTGRLGDDVVLEVSDRGPGIPEEERRRIFDAFYRIGDERTRTRPGTGLGLHIVQLQVQAMRARIAAIGRDGGGTTFRLTFRRARG